MSHNIDYSEYSEKTSKKAVEAEWNEIVRRNDWQEGATGLPRPIRWLDRVFDSREEAESFIDSIDSGNYDQLAVKFRRPKFDRKPGSSYDKLLQKKSETYKKMVEERNKFHFVGVKAEYISCKNCGSKIAKKFLQGNYCPVCREDMRPASALAVVERAATAYQKTCDAVDAKEKAMAAKQKNAPIYWLVKTEYHT